VAVDVETSIEIERPRSVVAAYVSDPDNATRWYARLKTILEADTDHDDTTG
jgi:hypothetical protein